MQISSKNFDDIKMIVESFEASSPAYWDEDRYLIMNENTCNDILSKIQNLMDIRYSYQSIDKYIRKMYGYRIVIDDELSNGIIDIR